MNVVSENLKKVISEIVKLSINSDKINETTNLLSDLGFDSIQIVQLIVEVEEQFGIEISDDDLDIANLSIYGKLLAMIEEKVNRT